VSLQPAKKNFNVWKGNTFSTRLTLLTGAAGSPAQDLTGYTASLEAHLPDLSSVLSLTTENGGITLGAASGHIDLFIAPVATAAFTWVSALYKLNIISPSAVSDPLIYGAIRVRTI
jgi:hypothetical protein